MSKPISYSNIKAIHFKSFCFRLQQSSFHCIISGGVVSGIGRNGNVLVLLTLILSSLWLHLWVGFLIFTRSLALLRPWLWLRIRDYDSDYDSVASENQPKDSIACATCTLSHSCPDLFLKLYFCNLHSYSYWAQWRTKGTHFEFWWI